MMLRDTSIKFERMINNYMYYLCETSDPSMSNYLVISLLWLFLPHAGVPYKCVAMTTTRASTLLIAAYSP